MHPVSPLLHDNLDTAQLWLQFILAVSPGIVVICWNGDSAMAANIFLCIATAAIVHWLLQTAQKQADRTLINYRAFYFGLLLGLLLPADLAPWAPIGAACLMVALIYLFGGASAVFHPVLATLLLFASAYPPIAELIFDTGADATPVASLLLLVGAGYLSIRGLLNSLVPCIILGGLLLLTYLRDPGIDPYVLLQEVFTFSNILAACFLAPIGGCTPMSRFGRAIYAGVISVLLFNLGNLIPSIIAVCLTILLAGFCTPLIDMICWYGLGKNNIERTP